MTDQLPPGWTSATIEQLAGRDGLMTDGDWIESKDQDPEGRVRLVQLADIGDGEFRDRSSRFLTEEAAARLNCTFLRKGDVLIARMPDPLGRACIFPGLARPAVTAVDICIWRGGAESVDPHWLMHTINSSDVRSQLALLAGGTTRQRVSGGNLKRFMLPVPPLPEQRRIVARIEALFTRTRRASAELERIAPLAKRHREKVLSNAFDMEAPRTRIDAVAQLAAGFGFPKDRQGKTAGEFPFAKVRDISLAVAEADGVLDRANNYLDADDLRTLRARPVPAMSTVFAKIGEGLRLNRRAITSRPMLIDNNCMALVPKRSLIDPDFLHRFMLTVDLSPFAVATSIPSVRSSDIAGIELPVPDLDEQRTTVRLIDHAHQAARVIERETARAFGLLERLERSILTAAFRGELVDQDAKDEPAAATLARLSAESTNTTQARRGRKPRERGSVAMLSPKERIEADTLTWPPEGLTFEQVHKRHPGDYDSVQQAIFALLEGSQPRIRQHFDEKERTIRLMRVNG